VGASVRAATGQGAEVPFQYPLRIERGCKRGTWFIALPASTNFQYPLRIERGCKIEYLHTKKAPGGSFSILCGSSVGASYCRTDFFGNEVSAFSILCGSSVGARAGVDLHPGISFPLSVSSADRAWVQVTYLSQTSVTPDPQLSVSSADRAWVQAQE